MSDRALEALIVFMVCIIGALIALPFGIAADYQERRSSTTNCESK